MTPAQCVVLCTACLGFLGAIVAALLPHILVNKNKEVYLLKKEAIFESLTLLDDYMALLLNKNDDKVVVRDKSADLTLQARDCLNKLLITCKDKKVIETFCAIIYPQGYGKAEPDLADYIAFKILCRRALGIGTKLARNAETITFLSDLNGCETGACRVRRKSDATKC